MRLRKLVFLMSTFLILCAFAAGQTQPAATDADAAKKKKDIDDLVQQMLDQSAADASGLRLPSNRAVIDAMTADIYWAKDEKRARELFHSAAGELITYNAETEKEAADNPDQFLVSLFDQNDPRSDVLNLVSRHDADLALEMLYQTRSAKLGEAMAKAAMTTDTTPDSFNPVATMDRSRAMLETSMEQRFMELSAKGDPDKLVKLIKDALAKGATPNMINLLQSLNQKDAKRATELGSDVIAKAGDADMAKNMTDLQTGLSFLSYAVRTAAAPPPKDPKNKQFAFDPGALKSLANKVADALLVPSKSLTSNAMITAAIPTLDKFVPERTAALKARDAENKRSLPTELKSSTQMANLWNSTTTPEDILSQISKMTNDNDKRNAYSVLASKIGQIADETRAKKLIDQIPDDKTRQTAQEQFDAARAGRAIAAGKVDDARRLIGAMTNRRQQIPLLVGLAMQSQRKATDKDAEIAKSLMSDAKALVRDDIADEDDLADTMEVVKGYATVDPDIAFRMFEPLADEFNNIIQASAVLSKYNKRNGVFKKGELLLRMNGNVGNGLLLFRYIPQIQLLGKADIEHMNEITGRFQRSDARAMVRLYVLQGFMAPTPKPPPPAAGGANTGAAPAKP